MRLIAWNANCNNRKHRTFEENAEFLFAEGADLIVVSETAQPVDVVEDRLAFIGTGSPGLAVMVRNGYTLDPSSLNPKAPPLFGGFHVHGTVSFNLLAVWPVQTKGGSRYSQLLDQALDTFGEFLSDQRTVMIGDFNSSSRVLSQKDSHPAFVTRAGALGLRSIYHSQTGQPHGEEKVHTYRHNDAVKSRFHLDYCFLSPALLDGANICVLDGPRWETLSDHYPIVVDVTGDSKSG